MPRTRRFEFAGETHHIMARGLEGCDIFADNEDRVQFLALLEKNLLRYNVGCLAYTLMTNHYHLLLKPRDKKLGECLRALNGAYAQYFNRRHARRGYLFQDRYKSVVSTGPQHTMETILYVHLNPLRAQLVHSVEDLVKYQWCSHTALLSRVTPAWFDREEALAPFSYSANRYLHELKARAGSDFGEEPHELLLRFSPSTNPESSEVFSSAEKSSLLAKRRRLLRQQSESLRLRRAELKRKGITLDNLAAKAEELCGLPRSSIMQQGRCHGRDNVHGRCLVCYWAYRELGISMVAIGEFFEITNGAVSRLVRRGEELAHAHHFSFSS